jgi:hypothetical protein
LCTQDDVSSFTQYFAAKATSFFFLSVCLSVCLRSEGLGTMLSEVSWRMCLQPLRAVRGWRWRQVSEVVRMSAIYRLEVVRRHAKVYSIKSRTLKAQIIKMYA